ncbi:hypothetical protein [Paenibacillus kandeliae]|uniref:hypothetical protein n=1 Tax=Paenibacillus kandeliae TaxID=3231269 RepID=UPI003458AF45
MWRLLGGRLSGLGKVLVGGGIVVVLGMGSWVGYVDAGGVPDEVRGKIEQELRNSQTQVHILGQNQGVQGHENLPVREDTYTLGEGYRYYVLDGMAIEQLGGQADERGISSDQVLDMAGYVFTTQYRGKDQSLLYASTPPKYDEITMVATSEGFSEKDFTGPLRHAMAWSQYDTKGMLIDDQRTGIKALVTHMDGQEQVMLLQNSMLLKMKQFDTLTLQAFVHRLWNAEQTRADEQLAAGQERNDGRAGEMSGSAGSGMNVDGVANEDESNTALRMMWGWVAGGILIVGFAGWWVARRVGNHRRQK